MSLLSAGGVGRVTSDVRVFEGGKVAAASAQMLFRERRLNRETQEWEDGRELWVTIKTWRGSATKLQAAGKGALVYVQGEFVTEKWQDKQTQQPRETIALHVRDLEQIVTGGQGGSASASPSDGTFAATPFNDAPAQQQAPQQDGFAGTWPEASKPGQQQPGMYDY